jgi:hypothetical protein
MVGSLVGYLPTINAVRVSFARASVANITTVASTLWPADR